MNKLILIIIIFIVIMVGQSKASDMVVDPYYGNYTRVFKCELPSGKIIDVVAFDTIYDSYYDDKLGRELDVSFDDNQTLKCSFKICKGK